MTPHLRKLLFETLYKNRYLYRFASTVPFAGQWRAWQRLVLSRIRGNEVLELGCGLGDLLADMLAAGYHCRAVEHSPEMVSAARDTLYKRGVGDPSTVLQGSAQKLPFSDSSFNTVVSTFPSEYIYDPDSITEIERVLRPGGRLIVVEGANLLPIGLLQPFLLVAQAIVYGPSVLLGSRKQGSQSTAGTRSQGKQTADEHVLHTDQETGTGVTTEVVPDAWFGRHIPLERCGLKRRSERVRSKKWEVFITIGEK